jgi:hypothetical protein
MAGDARCRMMRLAIRGFVAGVAQFEDLLELNDDAELDTRIAMLANDHAEALAAKSLHMIEIEFLDEPNPLQRYFRFGSDPQMMRRPVEVDLSKLAKEDA